MLKIIIAFIVGFLTGVVTLIAIRARRKMVSQEDIDELEVVKEARFRKIEEHFNEEKKKVKEADNSNLADLANAALKRRSKVGRGNKTLHNDKS